jgi:CheY-like chemotaxis protein
VISIKTSTSDEQKTADGMASQTSLVNIPSGPTKKSQRNLAQGHHTRVPILMVDDDSDDCLLAQEAWEEIKSENELRFVHDGQEVLDYVYHHGAYAEPQSSPRPGIILLDLNMPKKNGHEVLKVLKTDPQLHTIPIVVFTTTKNSDEIFRAYQEGANAFMTKPTSFEGFRDTLLAVDHYWLHLVQLPRA